MSKQQYYLVHANLAQLRAPLDDPIMTGFDQRQDKINSLTQRMPGFVIQPELSDEGKLYNGDMVLSVSVWEEVENLEQFLAKDKHAELLSRPEAWFASSDYPPYVLFWAPADGQLTEREIDERFKLLQSIGPSPLAFTLERRFTIEAMLTSQQKQKPRQSMT